MLREIYIEQEQRVRGDWRGPQSPATHVIERRTGEQFAAVREPGYKGTGAVMV